MHLYALNIGIFRTKCSGPSKTVKIILHNFYFSNTLFYISFSKKTVYAVRNLITE